MRDWPKITLEAMRRLKLQTDPRIPRYELPRTEGSAPPAQRIAVVGAGVTGLVTATLLRSAGHDVRVFEARERPGGRIYTHQPFASEPDLRVELGAARISDAHQHTMFWVRHLGLRTEAFYPSSGRLTRLEANERLLGPDVAWFGAHKVHHLVVGHAQWQSQLHGRLAAARELTKESLSKPNWVQISGGMSALPVTLAAELGQDLTLNTPVSAIVWQDGQVELSLAGETSGPAFFDKVVLALPYSALREIEISPPLSKNKQEMISQWKQQSSLRVVVTLRDRDWLRDGACGWGCTDNGFEVWRPRCQDSAPTTLVAYAQGAGAIPLIAQKRTERERQVVNLLEAMFPGIRSAVLQVYSHCWDEDPWSLGAQSLGASKEDAALHKPEFGFHFAGEHTMPDGWIDGAIQSAYRVVNEIL